MSLEHSLDTQLKNCLGVLLNCKKFLLATCTLTSYFYGSLGKSVSQIRANSQVFAVTQVKHSILYRVSLQNIYCMKQSTVTLTTYCVFKTLQSIANVFSYL